ncbi:hypothetical protein [Streptomyces sp. ME19-01-6]|uniref:glycoside hydrolase family 78 protein n=1 Tax=Streptomyces sp. ME19-01-6 TaxID=3028686 RepID=UPI0029B21410|nr:hypothetical protein [Streptomyces sp. ME19-01-6]MDX3232142.1 hypothetical protein [Streptomyces sp. ME19-01-6]
MDRPPRPPLRRRRLARLVTTALAALAALASTVPSAAPAEASDTGRPTALRTGALRQALGIDDTTPELSWRPTVTGRETLQRAYRVQAATSAARLEAGRPDLWDSGRVGSAAPRTTYAERAIRLRDRADLAEGLVRPVDRPPRLAATRP